MTDEVLRTPAARIGLAERAFRELIGRLEEVGLVDPDVYRDLAAAYCTHLAFLVAAGRPVVAAEEEDGR